MGTSSAAGSSDSSPLGGAFAGLLLAAGAGIRMGQPKALVRASDGEAWVVRGVRLLRESGCAPIVVVIGAAAREVSAELSGEVAAGVRIRRAEDWETGMSASLRAGLDEVHALEQESARIDGVIVSLVDLPHARVEEVARVVAAAYAQPDVQNALVQAVFEARPGHPVFIGRGHWEALAAEVHGDRGAKYYLREHSADRVECGDLGSGADVDFL